MLGSESLVTTAATNSTSGLAEPLATFGASAKAFITHHPYVITFFAGAIIGAALVGMLQKKATPSDKKRA